VILMPISFVLCCLPQCSLSATYSVQAHKTHNNLLYIWSQTGGVDWVLKDKWKFAWQGNRERSLQRWVRRRLKASQGISLPLSLESTKKHMNEWMNEWMNMGTWSSPAFQWLELLSQGEFLSKGWETLICWDQRVPSREGWQNPKNIKESGLCLPPQNSKLLLKISITMNKNKQTKCLVVS
jgi:hypothetical protein